MKKLSLFLILATLATFSSCKTTTESGVVINGVKWATRNIDKPGHFAKKSTDYGMYYQWNRKIGWSATDPMKNSKGGKTWDSTTPEGKTWAKANVTIPAAEKRVSTADGLEVLFVTKERITHNTDPSPAGWRVPTVYELETLLDAKKVTNKWTTQDGVNGRLFTDKATGNTLFLPAAGLRYYTDGTRYYVGASGYYWSSKDSDSRGTDNYEFAYGLHFWRGEVFTSDIYRTLGFSVRCVAE
jgi:uncharacterized protein (TIGR02145 family)